MTWRAIDVLHPIALRFGERIEYLGPGVAREKYGETLSPGDIGRVIDVRPIDPPDDLVVDEQTGATYAGRDGHALVKWPNFRPGIVWPDGEQVRWRKVATK